MRDQKQRMRETVFMYIRVCVRICACVCACMHVCMKSTPNVYFIAHHFTFLKQDLFGKPGACCVVPTTSQRAPS